MEQTAGRAGIKFEEVAAVADAIAARGDRPTLRGVRAEIGSGSMGTIQKHLAAWQSQRRQIVTSSATLPTEIQRVIIAEIEREIDAARATLEAELVATVDARDALADDNEQQAEQIEQQTALINELEINNQKQAVRISQLESDLEKMRQTADHERNIAEQARQALAKAELRLEALPRVEAENERLRDALELAKTRSTSAEQLAAVTTEKLASAEVRLMDSQAREKQIIETLAEAKKEAENKAQELEKEYKAAIAKIAASEQRANEAGLKAAELRGKLTAFEANQINLTDKSKPKADALQPALFQET